MNGSFLIAPTIRHPELVEGSASGKWTLTLPVYACWGLILRQAQDDRWVIGGLTP